MSENFESPSINDTREGFDSVLRNGLVPGQNILLLGLPFTGKSALAFQLLTRDTPEGIRSKASAYSSNLEDCEDRGELRYIDCYPQLVGLKVADLPLEKTS